MAESAQPDHGTLNASFSEHVIAFHRSLPLEEQALLERVFALAETAPAQQADTQGFAGPLPVPPLMPSPFKIDFKI